jgi:hypothetical protein
MAFTEIADLDCTVAYALGGKDKKTGKANPTQVEGYYIGTRQVESGKSKTGFAALHVFQTAKGNVGIWGKTNLDAKMRSVKPGTMTLVKFVGMQETKNNPMYKYSVAVDQYNMIDVGNGLDAVADAPADSGDAPDHDFGGHDENGDLPAVDELPPQRATPPARAAQAPSAERQAAVQALLNRGRAVK